MVQIMPVASLGGPCGTSFNDGQRGSHQDRLRPGADVILLDNAYLKVKKKIVNNSYIWRLQI